MDLQTAGARYWRALGMGVLALAGCWGAGGALAQTAEPKPGASLAEQALTPSSATALQRWYVQYDVAADGRASVTKELHQRVLQAQALPEAASYDFTFLQGLQQGQVLQAYTLKPDGRRVDAPAAQASSEAPAQGLPGRTRLTVHFADVAVGDTVAVQLRIDDQEAQLSGAFTLAHGFSPFALHADSRITVRAPKALGLRFAAHGLQALPETVEGEVVQRQWAFHNPTPRQWSAADAGLWRVDETPVLLVSSFADHGALAQAYGARAQALAEPTEGVRQQAQSIVADVTDPRERARLIYEWVSAHITSAGPRCLGLGAMVPRPPDAVLAQRQGDCKDQATLLQALLAAAGIRSEQVLMNAGEGYELPGLPVLSQLDHVIVYLPDWQLYLDASAPLVPFGYLPAQAYGKTVVHVGSEPAVRHIPEGAADANTQSVHSTLRIAADGSASGRMQVLLQGAQAPRMRDYLRKLAAPAQRDWVRGLLERSGYKGRGELEKGSWVDEPLLADRLSLALSFDIEHYLQVGTQGAFVLAPVVDWPLSVVRLAVADLAVPQRRVRCYGYRSEEFYDITLAPGVAFSRLPASYQVRDIPLKYSSHYERTAHGVQVQRLLRDETPQGLCEPAALQTWSLQAKAIAQNLQSPVYYRLPPTLAKAQPARSAPAAARSERAKPSKKNTKKKGR